MSRFLMRGRGVDVEVYDATTGDINTGTTVFGPAYYETASRWAADRNAVNSQAHAAPCGDCRAELQRLRTTLNRIVRHTDCEYARRVADEALIIGGK